MIKAESNTGVGEYTNPYLLKIFDRPRHRGPSDGRPRTT